MTSRKLSDRLRRAARNRCNRYKAEGVNVDMRPEDTLDWQAADALDSRDTLLAEGDRAEGSKNQGAQEMTTAVLHDPYRALRAPGAPYSGLALCLSTKDRVELSRQSVVPLIHPDVELWIVDGSSTQEGKDWAFEYREGQTLMKVIPDIRGGADAAIVHNLSLLLKRTHAEYVGLVENDVLLDPDWLEPTMELFAKGKQDGLPVGAVSARCYEDRVLLQQPDYAVMHNLGAGMVIFTREAARLALRHFRTTWTTENREVFSQLSGLDIGRWWAFGGNTHWLTADWGFEKVLAQHGLAALACTPNRCQMIGQIPPLADQGLVCATAPLEARQDGVAFERYRTNLNRIRIGALSLPTNHGRHQDQTGGWTIFPHQFFGLGAVFQTAVFSNWELRWVQGFGPFAWVSGASNAQVMLSVFGPCDVLVGGGPTGGRARVQCDATGFDMDANLAPDNGNQQVASMFCPAGLIQRTITLTLRDPGMVLYGLGTRYAQPCQADYRFDYSVLPPAADAVAA